MPVHPKQASRLFMILGIVLTLLSMGGVYFISRSATKSGQGTGQVLVASRQIPANTVFTSVADVNTWLKPVTVSTSTTPVGSFASVRAFQHQMLNAGKQATTEAIAANEPVVSTMFTNIGSTRTGVTPAFGLKRGDVAISLQVSAVNDSAQSVQPGDYVDIISSFVKGSGGSGGGDTSPIHLPTQTQYVLQNIKVMAIGQITPSAPTGTASGASSGGDATMLTLEVDHQTALIIQHLKDFSGSWATSVVLTSALTHRKYQTAPVKLGWFVSKLYDNFKR